MHLERVFEFEASVRTIS